MENEEKGEEEEFKLEIVKSSERSFAIPPWANPEEVYKIMDYLPNDGTAITCSYPKTGSTLMDYIVLMILHKKAFLPSYQDLTLKYVPFIEMTGLETIESQTPPYQFKTHVPYHAMNINKNAKYIYTIRNPMDVVVSFYHFIKNDSTDFNNFFDDFIDGTQAYGDYFDHILDIYKDIGKSHVHIIFYENLLKNKKKHILSVAEFLGLEYYQHLMENDNLLQEIIKLTDFKYMKEHVNEDFQYPNSEFRKLSKIFRKGEVGDGKNLLTPEQKKRLEQKVLDKLSETIFPEMWTF